MAYPVDTVLETGIAAVELALTQDMTIPGLRETIGKWREVLAFIELDHGSTAGYDALAQRDWSADDLYTGPND
jgi:hypothetical protein